jgi:hypothetical protein
MFVREESIPDCNPYENLTSGGSPPIARCQGASAPWPTHNLN